MAWLYIPFAWLGVRRRHVAHLRASGAGAHPADADLQKEWELAAAARSQARRGAHPTQNAGVQKTCCELRFD